MDDLIRFLEHKTGGEFYLVGAWKDFKKGYVTHSQVLMNSTYVVLTSCIALPSRVARP